MQPPAEAYRLSPAANRVFIGLLLSMFVASISQTIVGPAMPRIVSDLGGMAYYSWVATASMLVSAITVPIVGKLSDLYGRRGFYLMGLVVFMIGSLVAGFATNFWMLVAARAIQGVGMGTVMPLSQTIIGDLVPPRQRGKYQGILGAVFGLTAIVGPAAGGVITDHWGWRWLFIAPIPISLVATFVIVKFLHLPHQRIDAKVDSLGIGTLTIALTAILLATSWGGTTYPWGSGTILGLYAVGIVALAAFIAVELRADEPVMPLRLFRSLTFTASNLALFGTAMILYGFINYIPVFAQGVIGVNATNSGLILVPLMVGLIGMGLVTGLLITRTGKYKSFLVVGVLVIGAGMALLVRMTRDSSQLELTIAMIVVGIGLGMSMQQYTLVVQNASQRRDLGVATASTQFFRNVGAVVGIAIFGTVLTSALPDAIAAYLPPGSTHRPSAHDGTVAAVLDPGKVGSMPPALVEAIRSGLADRLHVVFLLGIPITVVILLATLAIKAAPMGESVHDEPETVAEELGHEILDSMNQTSAEPEEAVPPRQA